MIKDLMEQERQRLQGMIDGFLAEGSWIRIYDDGVREPFYTMAVDNMIVTRVKPIFDADGNHVHTEFWVMWNGPGYDQAERYTHTIHIKRMEMPDTFIMDLHDGKSRFNFEHLFPDVSPPERVMHEELMRWRQEKAADAERFARIDANLLEIHQENARTWDDA